MPAEITPDGAFPELFSEYVEYKRGLGYVYPDSRLYLVRRLSRFLATRPADERVLTRQSAEAFASPCEAKSPGSAAGRRGIARQFALFLRWKGIDAWVLPEREQPRQPSSFAPRIITADEMARVIACADARPASRCGPQTQPVYAMLVRLLWCCGLRIGEALSLLVGDVDLVEAVITVRKAKHNRTRLVPMSPSLTVHARRYSAAAGLVPEDPVCPVTLDEDVGVIGGEGVAAGEGPAGGCRAGPWCAWWRGGGQSDVTSVTAILALAWSTIALRSA